MGAAILTASPPTFRLVCAATLAPDAAASPTFCPVGERAASHTFCARMFTPFSSASSRLFSTLSMTQSREPMLLGFSSAGAALAGVMAAAFGALASVEEAEGMSGVAEGTEVGGARFLDGALTMCSRSEGLRLRASLPSPPPLSPSALTAVEKARRALRPCEQPPRGRGARARPEREEEEARVEIRGGHAAVGAASTPTAATMARA
mmetsp:Transcript_45294/g.144159  ORF Transcript_45294/g.144159 Transcript_45294/m.144159 type:complete len:206 (+) Transcript_45294:316-933(+)